LRWCTSISDEAILSAIIWSMVGISSSGMTQPLRMLRMLSYHELADGEMGAARW
jgi:hypothetical protein